jgi:tRNA threonylcarbamoyladenosine biosynthesis protein TsaB
MRILALDTATSGCSTAVLTDAGAITREIETQRGHAENILALINAVLIEAGIGLEDVDALAFGRGPGAFTGVRLATSIAQGLAFGAGLRVVAVSDLAAVAQRAFDLDTGLRHVLVCNDARMQEVYWGCFDRAASGLATPNGAEHVGSVASLVLPAAWHGCIGGAGRGFRLYPQIRAAMKAKIDVAGVWDELLPRAVEIARLAWPEVLAGRAGPPEAAIPVYVRDDVMGASRK